MRCVDDSAADEDEMETDEASADVAMGLEMVATVGVTEAGDVNGARLVV